MTKSLSWRNRFSLANLWIGHYMHMALTILAVLLILFVWYRGSRGPLVEPKDVTDQRAMEILRNLRVELQNGAADRMQVYFPEGACFINTLYGLAWANLALNPANRDEALTEIQQALAGQTSSAALEPFRWRTQVPKGAFWLGQRNLLLGKYLTLKPSDTEQLTSLTLEFHENASLFYTAVVESPVYQVESYEGMCWPADGVAGLVSLKLHDDLYGTSYANALDIWTKYHSANGWNNSILPPGKIDVNNGRHLEPARGCANSFIIAILAEVLPDYSAELYRDYQKSFQIARCGFGMFREYPDDSGDIPPDVDSGPILMDAGVSATGIGFAASRAVGDRSMERDIRDLSEIFGFPYSYKLNGQNATKYLGGLLPIGDAFLAWGYSMPRPEKPLGDFAPSPANRSWFHGIAITGLALLAGQWFLLSWQGKKRRNKLLQELSDQNL